MAKTGSSFTLAAIQADLETRLDDTDNTRWSDAQMQLAIRAAVRKARTYWWDERLDDTNTYDYQEFRYSLPPACQGVEEVWLGDEDSTAPRWRVPARYYHVEHDELVFTESLTPHSGESLYIIYNAFPMNLLSLTGTGTLVSNVMTDGSAAFSTNGVSVGDEVLLCSSASGAFVGTFYVKEDLAHNTETTLALHKAPSVSGSVTYYVAYYTSLPYEYLIYGAMAELYEMALRNRPGVEIKDYVELSTYYRQMAAEALMTQRKRPRVRYGL